MFGADWMYLDWAREIITTTRKEIRQEYTDYIYSMDSTGGLHLPMEIIREAAQHRYGIDASEQHEQMIMLDADTGLGVFYLSSESRKPRNDNGTFAKKTQHDDVLLVLVKQNPRIGGKRAFKMLCEQNNGEIVLSLPTINRRLKEIKKGITVNCVI